MIIFSVFFIVEFLPPSECYRRIQSESAAHIDIVVKTIDSWGMQPAEIKLGLKFELGWLKVGLTIFSKTQLFLSN